MAWLRWVSNEVRVFLAVMLETSILSHERLPASLCLTCVLPHFLAVLQPHVSLSIAPPVLAGEDGAAAFFKTQQDIGVAS
jgi:hypothetical protein